jgi:hypothetical protein
MSEDKSIWSAMVDISDKMFLEKSSPNKTLVAEALSFDASKLDIIEEHTLRKYLVVLGQYLITLQYEENKAEAVCAAWNKSLDSYIFRVVQGTQKVPVGVKTLSEKRAWVIENDEQAAKLNDEFQLADATRAIISNMHKPVEQYINTLKKEIDARENEKKRS